MLESVKGNSIILLDRMNDNWYKGLLNGKQVVLVPKNGTNIIEYTPEGKRLEAVLRRRPFKLS